MIDARHPTGARGARTAADISAFVAVLFLVPLACGSSSRDDIFGGSGAGGQAPATGGSSGGGAGGAGGGGGSATGGGAATGGSGMVLGTCRDVRVCPTPAGQIGCCTSDFRCGLRVGTSPLFECVTPDPGGTPNAKCPTAFILDGRGAGCCRSNGTCGYTDQKYGAGCVDPAQLNMTPGIPCPP